MCYRIKMQFLITACVALLLPLSAWAQCPHPFMPYRAGAIWVYDVTGPSGQKVTLTLSVESIAHHNNGEIAKVNSRWSTITPKGEDQTLAQISQMYRCDADGMHTAPQSAKPSDECAPGEKCDSAANRKGVKAQKADSVESKGVALPPEAALQVGAEWSESFDMQVTRPANEVPVQPGSGSGGGSALGPSSASGPPSGYPPTAGSPTARTPQTGTRVGHATRESTNKVEAMESIKTPMGPVDAIKIVGEQMVKMPFDDRPKKSRSVTWLGRRVGMLRFTDGSQSMELVRFVPGS